MGAKTSAKPKCPACGKRVAYRDATEVDERGYAIGKSTCPYCGARIVWSQSFGMLTANGLERTPARPRWTLMGKTSP